jgi:hypothetical protein
VALEVLVNRSNTIVKTALTGKAATLIGGRTLASFVVRLEHSIKEKQFTPLDLLVIDEVSMMSKCELLKLDKLLHRYMKMENVPFGGVHVVLLGDFLQMPPVKSDPIYMNAAIKVKPSTADLEGFDLWRKIATVVILEESIRFRNDPEWVKDAGTSGWGNGPLHLSVRSMHESFGWSTMTVNHFLTKWEALRYS